MDGTYVVGPPVIAADGVLALPFAALELHVGLIGVLVEFGTTAVGDGFLRDAKPGGTPGASGSVRPYQPSVSALGSALHLPNTEKEP